MVGGGEVEGVEGRRIVDKKGTKGPGAARRKATEESGGEWPVDGVARVIGLRRMREWA